MAQATIQGLLFLGYNEEQGRNDKTYHRADFFDLATGEKFPMDMDGPANGQAMKQGDHYDVTADVSPRPAVSVKEGRGWANGRAEFRFRYRGHSKATAPVGAGA